MREKIAYANHQASLARERALQTGDQRAKEEWLKVARIWEALAHEYAQVGKLLNPAGAD